jgi:glycosidase
MGEDLAAEGRRAVRTPMQWTSGRNGGFSTAPPRRLISPVVEGGYGPAHVDAAQQRRDPDSHWSFMRRLIAAYRSCPELGWGGFEVLPQPHHAVLAHRSTWDDAAVVAVHNLGGEPTEVELTVADREVLLVDLLQDGEVRSDGRGRVTLELDGYGFRWLRVHPGDDARLP